MKPKTARKLIHRSMPRLPFLSLQMLEGRDVPASPFYVDDAWSNTTLFPDGTIVDADPAAPGTVSRTIGTDAFATIGSTAGTTGALGQVGVTDVIVNSGTYNEDVVVGTAVNLTFHNDPGAPGMTLKTLAASAGTIALETDLTVGSTTNQTISVVISGAGGLIKQGSGTLTLNTVDNTYTGATIINAGILAVSKALSLGTTAGNTTVVSGATLSVSANVNIAEPLVINGTGVSNVGAIRHTGGSTTTLSGGITLASDSRINNTGTAGLTIATGGLSSPGFALSLGGTGNFTNSASLNALGASTLNIDTTGTVTFTTTGSASFTGAINVTNGAKVTYNSATSIDIIGRTGLITLDNGTINNTNTSGGGGSFITSTRSISLGAGGGTLSWLTATSGLIIVNTTTLIGGSGGLTIAAAPNTAIAVASPCTYSGPTHIVSGIARVRSSPNRFPINTDLTVDSGAVFDLDVQGQTVGSLAGAVGSNINLSGTNVNGGTLTIGSGAVASTTTTYAGTFTEGTGKVGSIVKIGASTQILTGTGSNKGASTITAGTLLVGNTTGSAFGIGTGTAGQLTVDAGKTLGSISTANAGIITNDTIAKGTVAPGNLSTTGQLTVANLTFIAGSVFDVDIKGTTAGIGTTGYDQLVVTGNISIGNAKLNFNNTGTLSNLGDSFKIIDNVGAGTTTGTLTLSDGTPLPDNAIFTADGQTFRINYVANDVIVTRFNPPTPRYVSPLWATGFNQGDPVPDPDHVLVGEPDAVFGVTAFATIQSAITDSDTAAGDPIIINTGTYNEAVDDVKEVSLVFQEADSQINSLAGSLAFSSVVLNVNLTVGDNTSTSYTGSIGGTGGLIKTGAGALTLAGSNSYTGATTVADGKLRAGAANTFSPGSVMAVATAATVQLNGFANTIGNFTSGVADGTIENGGATDAALTVGNANDVAWTGTFQDGAGGGKFGLRKQGAGNMTPAAVNTFTGPLTLLSGSYSVGTLNDGGVAGPLGASTGDATNLVFDGGTLKYTGAVAASTNRNFTMAAGGGTISVSDAAGVMTLSGTFAGAAGGAATHLFTKSGAGKLVFSAADAFQIPTGGSYGSMLTGNVAVTGGILQVVNFRVNNAITGRPGGARLATISAGAVLETTGTLTIDPGGSYNLPNGIISGAGTLRLSNATSSGSNPTIAFDTGPNGGTGGVYGSMITASTIDFGTVSATIVGKGNRMDTGRYSGDLRFNSAITGAGNIQFIGLNSILETGAPGNSLGKHSMHYVLNGSGAGFSGDVFLGNADLVLSNDNALSAANDLTFNSVLDSNTTNRGGLFLYGHSVTIGSLNDVSELGTTSVIHNGARVGTNGVTNTAAIFSSVPLGLDSDSTLTITQNTPGTFLGEFGDGGNDRGLIGDNNTSNPGLVYHKLNVVKAGTAKLTLPATSPMTGSLSISAGSLHADGNLGTASGINVATDTTLSGSGTLPGATVSGQVAAGTVGTAGQLIFIGNLTFNGGKFDVDLLGVNPGSEHDKVVVTGDVDLNGAILTVNNTQSPAPPELTAFVLIENNGPNPITNTFVGYPEGEFLTVGGTKFQITYAYPGGTGNDCAMIVPPSSTTPVVTGFTVNSGYTDPNQRSRLTEIQVNFQNPVSAGSFNGLGNILLSRTKSLTSPVPDGTVVQTGAAGPNESLITVTQAGPNGLRLTFSVTGPDPTTAGVEYGSLSDGYWQLSIPSASGYLSGLNDTVLRRLFGDINNDGVVEGSIDFPAFGNSFNQTLPITDSPFDFNADGIVEGSVDFPAFGANFNVSL